VAADRLPRPAPHDPPKIGLYYAAAVGVAIATTIIIMAVLLG
jgi:hypothetical protein